MRAKYTFPLLTDAPSALVCVPIPIIPFFRKLCDEIQERGLWETRDDWRRAYQAFAELEEELMAGCMQALLDRQDRLYRLLDTALNGTEYTVDAPTELVIPSIAAVPPTSVSAPNALRAHVGRLLALAENSTSGATYAAGAGVDGAPALDDDQAVRAVLRRLIQGVDGGATPAPDDNLLLALRGTSEASTTRNVIDTQGSDLGPLLDQVETLLTEIRDKLA